MAEIDPKDPVFASRGIVEEDVIDRGYLRWTEEDYLAVIEESFAGIDRGGIQWLQKMAAMSDGIIITRHSPLAGSFERGLFPPEIRPDSAVQTGHPQRHFHADLEALEGGIFSLLPSRVAEAYCIPQLGGWRVLKFQHVHGDESGMSVEEAYQHQLLWHTGDQPRVHFHSLRIFPPATVKDHILTDAKKLTNEHAGVNDLWIHQHAPLAKYLFPPSAKRETSWNEDQHHDHGRMNPSELEWHLEHHHQETGGGL